jgi:hypothetical protein
MKNRRQFLVTLITTLVALTVVIGPTIAAELMGHIKSVNVRGKKVTIIEKEDEKEVVVTVTDDTEFVTPNGTIDLEKLAKNVAKAKSKGEDGDEGKGKGKGRGRGKDRDKDKDHDEDKEAGTSGPMYRVTHQKRVASKIEQVAKKKD